MLDSSSTVDIQRPMSFFSISAVDPLRYRSGSQKNSLIPSRSNRWSDAPVQLTGTVRSSRQLRDAPKHRLPGASAIAPVPSVLAYAVMRLWEWQPER